MKARSLKTHLPSTLFRIRSTNSANSNRNMHFRLTKTIVSASSYLRVFRADLSRCRFRFAYARSLKQESALRMVRYTEAESDTLVRLHKCRKALTPKIARFLLDTDNARANSFRVVVAGPIGNRIDFYKPHSKLFSKLTSGASLSNKRGLTFNSPVLFLACRMRSLPESNRHDNLHLRNYGASSANINISTLVCGGPDSSLRSNSFVHNVSPWLTKTLSSFILKSSGFLSFIQLNPFVSGHVTPYYNLLYKSWIRRLSFYQKSLGHRFFMEESINVMHLAMHTHDARLFSEWLASLIKRISFWKTRSIFRFLRYIFLNFFIYEIRQLGCKGLRLRLKGKISAAGNSRKRVIHISFAKNSNTSYNVKCAKHENLISTFTGVQCLRTEIYY